MSCTNPAEARTETPATDMGEARSTRGRQANPETGLEVFYSDCTIMSAYQRNIGWTTHNPERL